MGRNEHQIIVESGWSYRTNDRGWVIYRDPQTGVWHTRSDAIAIVEDGQRAKSTGTPRRQVILP